MAEGDTTTDTTPEGEGDGLVETIRSVVSETLGELFGTGKADVADKAEATSGGDPEARTWTPREIQEAAAAEMRRVQDELRAKAKAKPRRQEQPAAGKKDDSGAAGDANATSPPATTAPTNPKSWRNKLWGTA